MKEKYKKIVVMWMILILCVTSVFSTSAAKKIKSKAVTLHINKATISIGDVITLDATMNPVNSTDSLKWSTSNMILIIH